MCSPENAADIDLLPAVEKLVRESLVRRVEGRRDEPRFVLLETLHEYARQRLAERADAMALADRHAAHFLTLAETAEPELIGSQQPEWLDRLEDEIGNLRAALGWALTLDDPRVAQRLAGALWRFWQMRGYVGEGRRWLAAALARPDPEPRAERGKALNAAGVLAFQQGDYAAARTLIEEDLALRQQLGDDRGMAQALNNLGVAAKNDGDLATARTLYERSLALRRALHDRWGIAQALNNLGTVARAEGDFAAARALHEESLGLRRELGDHRGIVTALIYLGLVAREEGDFAASEARYVESLRCARLLGNQPLIAEAIEGLAIAGTGRGEAVRAARLFGAAAALREALGVPLSPDDRKVHTDWETRARGALSEGGWQATRAAGGTMSLEQAVAEAIAGDEPAGSR